MNQNDPKKPKHKEGKLYSPTQHREELKNFDQILEIHKQNLISKIERQKSNSKIKWNQEGEMVMSNHFDKTYMVKESADGETEAMFIPRFSMKKFKNPIFAKFPPNKELKYNRDLLILAMEYGMILQVQYRGEDDSFVQGRTRVIYPMCLGTSSKGKPLLRVYHLKGWSYSLARNTNKDDKKKWRMFRTDRILSMSFTGSFFRLAPDEYNAKDKGMRSGIIKAVNFQEVRRNQKKLSDDGSIQDKKEVLLDEKRGKITVVEALNSNSILDLKDPWSNPNLEEKDKKLIRITFLKNQANNSRIAILGALGKKGNIVKISASGKFLGTYRVLRHTMGDGLGRPHMRQVQGSSAYALMMFVKKRN
jgi:hypothetical protein